MLGDTQKRFRTIEGTVSDCEVLLHSLPTLSRIVAGRKLSYVWGEDLKPGGIRQWSMCLMVCATTIARTA